MRKNVGRAMVGFSHYSRCRNYEHSSPVHNIIFFSSYIFSLCLFLLIETPSIVKCLAHCKYSTLVDLFFHHNSQKIKSWMKETNKFTANFIMTDYINKCTLDIQYEVQKFCK